MPVATLVSSRTRVRFALCFWLFVLSSVSYLDRTNIAIAGTQIIHQFGFGNQQLGWIFSAFLIGYASFQIPAGMLAVRFGPRRVLSWGVLIWAVCNVFTALLPSASSHTIVLLMALRFSLGVAEAVVYPATNQFVARWVPQKERGFVNGLIFAGVGAGSAVAPPLLTWIILNHGWRAAFWIDATLGALCACVWWVIARDRPADHPKVSPTEQQEIEQGLTAFATTATAAHVAEHRISWRAILSRIDLPALMVGYFALGYTSWVFLSWFYLYMAQARGLNLKTSAEFTMMPFICMTVFCLGGGFTSDFLTRTFGLRTGRCYLASLSMLLTAIFLTVGSRVSDAFTAAVVLALGAGSLYFAQSSFWSVSTDLAGKNSGVFSSIVNMSGQIGGALTASLTPWLAQHYDWKMPFTVAACLAFLGSLTWLMVHPERPLEV